MANLSAHFTLEELVRSQRAAQLGISNIPDDEHLPNGMRLCNALLEPARKIIGMPLYINSGYRCPQLNAAVGGVKNSAHMDFRAADIIVPGMDLSQAWGALTKAKDELSFDQLIMERNGFGSQWIHLAVAPDGEEPRKQVLTLFQGERKFKS